MAKGFIKKKVSKKLQNFIDSITNVGVSTLPDDNGMVYYSKIDGSYLSRVGMEDELSFLLKRGITEQIQGSEGEHNTCCIGFNPIKQKWYGWSHRAICGFGIGSKCKQGHVGFEESNKEEFIKTQLSFWGDDDYADGEPKAIDKSDGVLITYVYNNNVANEKLRGTTFEHFCEYPDKWGRGEWTAMTLDEAKEMAMNFAECIS